MKNKARAAIRECDVVVVLIGQDTHNAQGVIVERTWPAALASPSSRLDRGIGRTTD